MEDIRRSNDTQQPDIVGDMLRIMGEALGEGFPEPMQRSVETRMRARWGGQEAYVKKKDVDAAARAQAIRSTYNMCNRRQLQAEFGISRAQFYKILKGG